MRWTFVPFALMSTYAWAAETPWTLDLESGVFSTRYNSARVPAETGSSLDLARVFGRQGQTFGRVELTYRTRSGPEWRLLVAPLSRSGSGVLDEAITFRGRTFDPGVIGGTYRFDSYRLTYRNAWQGGWKVGFTAKIRSAEISLRQNGSTTTESNVGFVPLLHIAKEGSMGGGWGYVFEMDGLAGGPGRAFDITTRITKNLGHRQTVFLGYRVLEGGADVPRVKNFAWINFVTAGVRVRF